MITHAQARSMAEAQWGTGGTTSYRTNRRGAFYFSCSGHGGFIIDSRCLTDKEIKALGRYCEPEETSEWVDETGKSRRIFNPFRLNQRRFKVRHDWVEQDVFIYSFEEDAAWCLPAVWANIWIEKPSLSAIMNTFSKYYAKSLGERLSAARALSILK